MTDAQKDIIADLMREKPRLPCSTTLKDDLWEHIRCEHERLCKLREALLAHFSTRQESAGEA